MSETRPVDSGRRRPDAKATRIGLHYRPTDLSMPIVDLALAAEERGFASLYLPEHTHVPAQVPATRPALGHGSRREVDTQLRAVYKRILDPYVALAFVAARTNLTLGTCIAETAQHDPIALAKTVATLDHLSGGRVVLGVGAGWDDREFENHGRPRADRLAVFCESLDVLRSIWTQDEAEFRGEYFSFDALFSWPKPTRRVPMLLGCRARPRGFEIVARQCEGWIPQDFTPSATLAGDLVVLGDYWAAAGRTGGPTVVPMEATTDEAGLRAALETYRELGIADVVLDLPSLESPDMLRLLDERARIVFAT
jgi:probable F420-dependent oxidoreductase